MALSQSRKRGHRLTDPALMIVLGGGFGGLAAVRRLRNEPVRVTWIDRDNHHLFQPLLYQVATGALSPADIAAPLRGIARGCRNIDVVLDEVIGIDPESRAIKTARQIFAYDYLIVATGAETSYFGNDKWARRADGLKTLEEAIAIRSKILLCLELAETTRSKEDRRGLLTFVLIGAGPTGVEMAGAIADLAKHILVEDYRHIEPGEISVVLIEAMDQVLPEFPKELAAFAEHKLRQLGVDLRTATKVEDIDDDGVVAAGERIRTKAVIWSAGVKATPVADWLKAEADSKGRVKAVPDLSIPNRPEVFVIGDAAAASNADGRTSGSARA
jgi:NADH dehydrogenase